MPYTPSEPLERAWKTCLSKKYTIVSSVFPSVLLERLMHGEMSKTTRSGRSTDTWKGAPIEFEHRYVIDRQGRYDMKLPDFVVDASNVSHYLEPLLKKLRTIMGPKEPRIRTHNVMFVPVGCKNQAWHTDDRKRTDRKYSKYFTILVQLNDIDDACGGTELYDTRTRTSRVVRCKPGDAFVFSGDTKHRGLANNGRVNRFFYYCSFSCNRDFNV